MRPGFWVVALAASSTVLTAMKRIQAGPLAVWATGGTDQDGGGNGPAIVLCHGFGAPGEDLVPLARVIDAGPAVRWFFPEAPLSLEMGFGPPGRAWWMIDMERIQQMMMRGTPRDLAAETPEGLAEAREALEACLAALAKSHKLVRERTLLGGFSQGAMLCTEVQLNADEPFAGLAILSGALISEDRWRPAAAARGKSIHAIATHGRRDPILPFSSGEALSKMLEASGATIRFVGHNGAHEIPPVALQALADLARDRLA